MAAAEARSEETQRRWTISVVDEARIAFSRRADARRNNPSEFVQKKTGTRRCTRVVQGRGGHGEKAAWSVGYSNFFRTRWAADRHGDLEGFGDGAKSRSTKHRQAAIDALFKKVLLFCIRLGLRSMQQEKSLHFCVASDRVQDKSVAAWQQSRSPCQEARLTFRVG